MSELQADIDLVLQLNSPIKPIREATQRVVEAARKYANPDIEAARESVDMPAVVLLLWRIMELAGMPVGDVVEKDLTGFAMMIRDSIVNRELFEAALGVTEDE